MEYKLRFEDHKGNFLNEDHLILDPKDILVITIPKLLMDSDAINEFQDRFKGALEERGILLITDDVKLKVLKFGEGVDE